MIERHIILDGIDLVGFYGAGSTHLQMLKKLHPKLRIVARDNVIKVIAYEQLTEEIMRTHTLIINCTPLGMVGHGIDQCPTIPYEQLNASHLLYDIVYNPENTLFLQKGAAQGAATKSGYEMWYLQALASWEIWNK